MELDISKSNKIISFEKKKNSYLIDDAIFYSTTGTIGHPEEAFHINQSKFINLSQTKDLKLTINNEIMYIDSKEITNESYLFSIFFNYLKIIYEMNAKNNKFQNNEEIKFNIKDFKNNLRKYCRNEMFPVIINVFSENISQLNKITEIIEQKLSSFLVDISNLNNDLVTNIMKNINDDYHQVFKENFDHIKIFKTNSEEGPSSDNKIINFSSGCNTISCDVILNNLDEVKENNYLLRKFILEISKTFFFEIIKFYDSANSINYSNNYIFSYFINESSFGFEEEDSSILKHEVKKLDILTETYNQVSSECLNLKKSLRETIYEKNIYPIFCFKCGNLMKRKDNLTPATCKIDNKCTEQSYFFCYKCKIDFCTYCIKEVKDGKCGKGHLIFKFGNISDRSCVNCLVNINNECYMCNLCEVTICISCYENINPIKLKCEKCQCNMLWRRSTLNFCESCNEFSQNFWECFFCENSYCIKCFNLTKNYCGAGHLLEEVDLNELSSADYIKGFNKPNSEIFCLLHIMNFSCSYCKKTTIPKFKYCKRCHFNLCQSCLQIND